MYLVRINTVRCVISPAGGDEAAAAPIGGGTAKSPAGSGGDEPPASGGAEYVPARQ